MMSKYVYREFGLSSERALGDEANGGVEIRHPVERGPGLREVGWPTRDKN